MFKRRKGSIVFRSLALVVILISSILFPACSLSGRQQPTPTPQPTIGPTLYPAIQGLYESCSPDGGTFCLERLKQMASAGFTLVVNYDQLYGSAEQQLAYAKQAHSLGMKVIWGMSDPAFWNGTNLLDYYGDLSATCGCSDNKGFIHYMVSLVAHLPATWGYYVGDEVKRQDHDKMKAFADLIKQLDPSHPRLFVSTEDTSTNGANLVPFVDTAEVLGGDTYPISTSEPVAAIGKISRSIQSIADRYDKQSIIVLQAFNWAQYPQATWVCSPLPDCAHFPTEDEMRQMRDLAVNNAHLQFILWYSYFDILNSKNPSAQFKSLIGAASSNLTPATRP